MKKDLYKFMTPVENVIGNHRQPIFKNVSPSTIYFDAFDEDHDADNNVLL